MWIWKVLLAFLVVAHLAIVLINLGAFFILPFTALILDIPFWYSVFLVVPIESLILFLSFNRSPCPMTVWENYIRKKLGMKEIGGFIGHYLIKQRWRKKKGKHAAEGVCLRTDS